MASSGSQYKLLLQAHVDGSQVRKQIKNLSKDAKLKINTGSAKKNVDSLGGSISDVTKKIVMWGVATNIVYQSFNQLKQGVSFISDLNNSMTQIQMVSGMTADETANLAEEYNGLAKALSATTLEVANGALEWVKQGKTAEEATQLVTASVITSKLAMIDSAQATEYLTSIMNGFKFEAEDMIDVMDKLVAIDNESATSVAEIAQALQRSSSSAQEAGVTFDELTSYISTVSSVTRRSARSIGESFKTMFARMQSVKLGSTLDEFGEDVSNVEEALRKVGIEVRDSVDEFRPMGAVIDDVAKSWENLTSTERAQVAEAIAGKRQRENFLVLMNNYNDALDYQEIAANAAGLALERYDIYQESIAAHADRLTATWEELWIETLNSDTIKNVYDLAAGLLEIITGLGGLDNILPGVIVLVGILKAQMIAGAWEGFLSFLYAAAGGLDIISASIVAQTSAMGGLQAAWGGFIAMLQTTAGIVGVWLVALIAVYKAYAKTVEMLDEVEKGQRKVNASWEDFFTRVSKEETSATAAMERYKKGLDAVAEGYENASWWAKRFIDKQELLNHGLDDALDFIKANSDSYEEYIALHRELVGLHGEEATGVGLTRIEYRDLVQHANNAAGAVEGFAEAEEEAIGSTGDLADTLSDLQDSFSDVNKIASKALEEGISYDDVVTLSKHYDNYLDLLEIEGGLVKLNTDLLRDMNVEKAQAAVETAKQNDMSEEGILILENYVEQLERAVPMSREYTETLQELMSAEELQQSAGYDLANQIGMLSDQFERGILPAEDYFNALNESMQGLSLADFGGDENAMSIFFAGMTQEASASLIQISSMFDAGEITITDYMSQLTELTGLFQTLGDFAVENLGAMGLIGEESLGIISSALGEIGIGFEQLSSLQESTALMQEMFVANQAGNLEHGSKAFNEYARRTSDALALTDAKIYDTQNNLLTGSDAIYDYMTGTVEGFNSVADQTANNVGKVISGILNNLGDMLVGLGDAIKEFKGTITITPRLTGSTAFEGGFLGEVMNFLQVPSLALDISSSGFEGIGNAVAGMGADLQAIDLDFNADIFSAPMNQVEDAVGGASSAYDNLSNSINNATGAQQGLNDAVDEFRQKQIDALNEQLRLYGRIIDKRKDLLKSMADERAYQNELEDQNRDIADIKNELLELALDDSEEAQAKRAQLEAELQDKEKALADFQFEQGIEQQQKALDQEYEAFEDFIKQAIYLVKTIPGDTEDVFLANLLEELGFIPTEGMPSGFSIPTSSGFPGAGGELNAQLEAMVNGGFNGKDGLMDRVSRTTSGGIMGGQFGKTPEAELMANGSGESLSIKNLIKINVQGNLDESVMPEIDRIANRVIRKLNKGMNERGIVRGAKTFSI